jgi:hypothetical protein
MSVAYTLTLTDAQDAAVGVQATAQSVTNAALITQWATERLTDLYRSTHGEPAISQVETDAIAFAAGVTVTP